MARDDGGRQKGISFLEQIKPAAIKDVIGGPALPIDRYHL